MRKVFIGLIFMVFSAAVNADAILNHKYGLGFQSGFASYGLAGRMAISDKVRGEAILGLMGSLSHYGARGLYLLKDENTWNTYAFGNIGIWRYSGFLTNETAFGFGGGVGIEYDWRTYDEKLPPVAWNLEVGFGVIPLDTYSVSSISVGAGARYLFN